MSNHTHTHDHTHTAVGNIRIAFLINLSFTILEFIGGLFTNSIAILADAVHDLGDSAALGLAWYLERYAQQESTWTYSYGYRRFSLLGALINSGILVGGSLFILAEALPRLLQPEATDARGMVIFAVIGVVANGLAALRLRGSQGMNARVVALHLLEDVLGWVAVLVVSIVLFFTDWYILDPLLSVLITGYILIRAARNLRQTMRIFLQATPHAVDIAAVDRQIGRLAGVQSTHHTHIWSLDGEQHVLTTHVVVGKESTKGDIVRVREQVQQQVQDLGLAHLTISVEYEDEACAMQPEERGESRMM